MELNYHTSAPSQAAVDSAIQLYKDVRKHFPRAVEIFKSSWTAWHDRCLSTDALATPTCTETDEFKALVKLGPRIVPLVVYELARDVEQNYSGVLLYNELEYKPEYDDLPDCRVSWDVASKEVFCGLGKHIVEKNHERGKLVNACFDDWKRQNHEHRRGSSSGIFTFCEEYFKLIELGPSIIAPAMVEYAKVEGSGWWWQLVYELNHGKKLEAYMIDRRMLYQECVEWFNSNEPAPEYTQSPWDRYFLNSELSDAVREYRKAGKVPPSWREEAEMAKNAKQEKEAQEKRDGPSQG